MAIWLIIGNMKKIDFSNLNKKELLKTLLLLAVIIVIATILVNKLSGGETLSEYETRIKTEAMEEDK